MSTGSRAHHKSVATDSNVVNYLDHDYHRGSLTPSVELEVSTPESRQGSWYSGNIFVILKDSVFEASSVWQHCAQLTLRLLREGAVAARVSVPTWIDDFITMSNEDRKRILRYVPFFVVLSTDGGPDHKNTNIATKAALLETVIILDLASLVAFRNAPDCS